MENNSALKEFVQSMASLVDSRLNKLRLDYTAEAEIMSVENADEGEYKVLYQSNIFSAFAGDENKKYKVGDMVYILVPQNNFNMKKIIIGKVSKNSFNKVNMNLSSFIVANGPSINSFYYDAEGKDPINEQNWGLIVGKNGSGTYQELKIIDNEAYDPFTHESFIRSAINNEHIEIQASFLTSFQKQMIKGNYGLKVTFYVKNPEYNDNPVPENVVTQDFIFDIDSFNGAPYDFRVWSPQVLRFSTQKDYLLGLKSIYFFEEGFEQDEYKNGTEIKKQTTNPNLFVKDIKLQFIDSVNLIDNLFYLNIVMPNGNNLGKKDVILNGVLYSGGEDVLNPTSAKCYWYERDGSVVVDGEGYDPLAGPGWKKVTDTENVVTVDFNQLILHQGGSSWISKEFKLVIKYKDENIITKTVTVYNSDSPYNLKLIQITDPNGHVRLQIEGLAKIFYRYKWYIQLPDGQYKVAGVYEEESEEDWDDPNRGSLDINKFLCYSFVDFSVDIEKIIGEEPNKEYKYYCTLYKTVNNVTGEEDVIVSYVGTDMYQYDANGDITIDNAELERILKANITWADGKGSSNIIKWLDWNGIEITKEDDLKDKGMSQPENCMMKDMWMAGDSTLHYKVKPKFNLTDSNNFVILRIITVDNQIFDFKKEIAFFKDGDQGTNGTTFACVIRLFSNTSNERINGFYPLIKNNDIYSFYQSVYPKVLVYKDGELISSSNNRFQLSYSWSGINVSGFESIKTDNLKGQSFIISDSTINTQAHTLKVQVTITDKNDNQTTQIYYNYPLIIWLNGNPDDVVEVSIPSLIMYAASGINPSFLNNPVYVKISNSTYTPQNPNYFKQYGCLKQKTTNTWNIIKEEYFLNPPAYYLGEDPLIGSGIIFDNDNYSFNYSILCYLNTYGNEAINGWDGTAIKINEDKGYILAPQVGAGAKDSDNKFTGVIMGKDTDIKQFGLYGYDKGIQTFGLKADGKAFFGATGSGRINIEGDRAVIYGGMTECGANSMVLTLHKNELDKETLAINIIGYLTQPDKETGELSDKPVTKFSVDYNGRLVAEEVDIRGNIRADSGYIGGWVLQDNMLVSEDKTANLILDGRPPEYDEITGQQLQGFGIVSDRGLIGGFDIGTHSLQSRARFSSGTRLPYLRLYAQPDPSGFIIHGGEWYIKSNGDAMFNNVTANNIPSEEEIQQIRKQQELMWQRIMALWNKVFPSG